MPFTSTQVSGLVGGQQVMFANQATFANQIGGLGGGSQQMMANPYPSPSYGVAGLDPASPDIGAKLAGGIAMTLPGMATGATMAASMLGYKSPLGLLDPFTGVSRAFGAGTGGSMATRVGVMAGSEGMGIKYAAGNIGRAFATGGMRAGLGVAAGGVAGAATAALPYYMAYKGAEYVAENLYQGVQNVQDVRRMTSQYFEPQYGQPGARMGGRGSSGMVKGVTSFLHEIASEDTMTSMKDMRQLMDRAGSMGMLQGIGDVTQFKQRFKGIVSQAKKVAQMLGTTLEEAMPLVGQLNQMGTWTAKDVMGTAVAAKAAGPGGAPAMMGAMQQGAQMSYQMGGRLESGAILGRELFGQLSAATRTGALTEDQLRQYTGGVGGAEGRRMVAGSMQQVMAGMGQTAMGRMMMAGLGEIKGGEFTGKMDERLLSRFQRGEVGVDELQRMGKQRVASKDLAVSFFNKADELGQSMAQQGGIGAMAAGIQQVIQKRFGDKGTSAPIENRFIQLLTGAGQRQADMIQKLIQDLPRLQAEQERANEAAMEDSFRQLEERRHRSYAGIKDAVGKALEEGVGRPLQELSEGFTTMMSESFENAGDFLTGRTEQMPKVSLQQAQLLARTGIDRATIQQATRGMGPRLEEATQESIQDFVSGGVVGNLTRQFEQGGASDIFRPLTYTGVGNRAELGRTRGLGSDEAANLSAVGAQLVGAGVGFTRGKRAETDIQLGGGFGGGIWAAKEEVAQAPQLAVERTDPTWAIVGGEAADKRDAMEHVKRELTSMMSDPAVAQKLMEEKADNPHGYNIKMLQMLKSRGGSALSRSMATLGDKSKGEDGESLVGGLNILSFATKESGQASSPIAASFSAESNVIGNIKGMGRAGLEKARGENIEEMQQTLDGWFNMGMDKGEVGALLSNKNFSAYDVAELLMGDTGEGTKRVMSQFAASDPAVEKLLQLTSSSEMSAENKKKLARQFVEAGAMQQREFGLAKEEKVKRLAAGMGPMSAVKGLEDITGGLETARKKFAAGQFGEGAAELTSLARGGLKEEQISALLGGRGGVFGMQVGREALIETLGKQPMKQGEFEQFRKKMIKSGVKFEDLYGQEVEDMLKSGGGLSSVEGGKLKERLRESAKTTVGEGFAGQRLSPMQEAQEKYVTAMNSFSQAVSKLVVVDKKDVKNGNPVMAQQTEGG